MNNITKNGKMLASSNLVFLLFIIVVLSQKLIGPYVRSNLYLSVITQQSVFMLLLPVLFIKVAGKSFGFDLKAPSTQAIGITFISAIALTFVSAYFLAITTHLMNVSKSVMDIATKLQIPTVRDLLANILIIAVFPAFCEEIFFRGICQTSISARYGNRSGIIITACLFAIVHWNPWFVHLFFLKGCFYGWIYMVSGTLWAPIMFHFVNNLLAVMFSYLKIQLPTGDLAVDVTIATVAIVLLVLTVVKLKTRPNSVNSNALGPLQKDSVDNSIV